MRASQTVRLCLAFGAAAWLLASAGCAAGRIVYEGPHVEVHELNYRGWTGSYRIANGAADVVVVPQIARVMHYAAGGGENVLWVNEAATPQAVPPGTDPPDQAGWVNYGGYKLWPAPQSRWGWPPPERLDAGVAAVELMSGGAVRLIGMADPEAGVRFDRIIRLAPSGTRLHIKQTMVNTSQETVQWALWDVTQVPDDCVVIVPHKPNAEIRTEKSKPLMEQWQPVDGGLLLRPSGRRQKIFVSGPPAWLAGRVHGRLFIKKFEMSDQTVPEDEEPRTVFAGDCGYIELEIVGPLVTLQPGESTSLVEVWDLAPAPAGDDPAAIMSAAAAAAEALRVQPTQ